MTTWMSRGAGRASLHARRATYSSWYRYVRSFELSVDLYLFGKMMGNTRGPFRDAKAGRVNPKTQKKGKNQKSKMGKVYGVMFHLDG